jgi:hypothetical protein
MSKKVDESYYYDKEAGEDEDRKCPPRRVPLVKDEDRKCPPRRVPLVNPNEEWTSHKPKERISLRSNDDPHQKHEAAAIEKAIPFDEKEEIKGGTDGHVLASNHVSNKLWASNEDSNTARGTLGDPHMVTALRGPDYSLGADSIQEWHCPHETEEGPTRESMFPGAFREGGLDLEQGYGADEFTATIEEEDEEQTPVATRERSINPISATLVDAKEEEMRLQEKINQALQRERQQAVVAQVAPGNRRRKWFVIGTIFLIVVALTTALALTLPSPSNNCGKDGYFGPKCDLYLPNCSVPSPEYIGNGVCDYKYNTTECEYDGGDCPLPCDNDGYFGFDCTLYYPNCSVPNPEYIGDGVCDSDVYNTEACGWDGKDCPLPCDDDGYFGFDCTLHYPNCSVPNPQWIGDGVCNGDVYNTEACGWDGKDCPLPCDDGYFGFDCTLHYPNCSVPYPEFIGDGACDGDVYNTEACGWDGTDCPLPCDDGYFGFDCTLHLPNCSVPNPQWIGDGACNGDVYNTEACGWDGKDCPLPCDDGYFGPNCTLYLPNCSVPSQYRNWIGNGFCDDFYNTTECEYDGGDCLPCKDGYIGFNCTFYLPNCSAPFPESQYTIGNGFCDDFYNTTECGNDGGDCLPCKDGYIGFKCTFYLPNCSVPFPESQYTIGNGFCDDFYNTTECGNDGGDCL